MVDGSTYYEADTSKLYVYCKNNWYEKKSFGVQTFDFTEIYDIGMEALEESGETQVNNIEITEDQYMYGLNEIKKHKMPIVIKDGGEDSNTLCTLPSFDIYATFDEEWGLGLPYVDGCYYFYAQKNTEDETTTYTLNVEALTYQKESE